MVVAGVVGACVVATRALLLVPDMVLSCCRCCLHVFAGIGGVVVALVVIIGFVLCGGVDGGVVVAIVLGGVFALGVVVASIGGVWGVVAVIVVAAFSVLDVLFVVASAVVAVSVLVVVLVFVVERFLSPPSVFVLWLLVLMLMCWLWGSERWCC